ncbi:MAG: hypothetical protein ABIM30_10085 [candidate division WOR-3 bacterium]
MNVEEDKVNTGSTTHGVNHAMGIAHTEDGGSISKYGGESVGRAQIEETLNGVGIGGDNVSRNSRLGIGQGTLINNSTNEGLMRGKVVSQRRVERIKGRLEKQKLNVNNGTL